METRADESVSHREWTGCYNWYKEQGTTWKNGYDTIFNLKSRTSIYDLAKVKKKIRFKNSEAGIRLIV